MVFQQFNLFPHMTALQNCIEAPIEVLGMVKYLLELVGLSDKKDEHPSRLGQQHVLQLQELVAMTSEITSALDLGVLNVIRSLNKEHNEL